MVSYTTTLYEVWWVSDTDEEDEVIYDSIWSLDIAKQFLYSQQQSDVEVGGHYCIVKVVSSYEEMPQ
jgi:hypothetical protein